VRLRSAAAVLAALALPGCAPASTPEAVPSPPHDLCAAERAAGECLERVVAELQRQLDALPEPVDGDGYEQALRRTVTPERIAGTHGYRRLDDPDTTAAPQEVRFRLSVDGATADYRVCLPAGVVATTPCA
jgi:hypothetical protein